MTIQVVQKLDVSVTPESVADLGERYHLDTGSAVAFLEDPERYMFPEDRLMAAHILAKIAALGLDQHHLNNGNVYDFCEHAVWALRSIPKDEWDMMGSKDPTNRMQLELSIRSSFGEVVVSSHREFKPALDFHRQPTTPGCIHALADLNNAFKSLNG